MPLAPPKTYAEMTPAEKRAYHLANPPKPRNTPADPLMPQPKVKPPKKPLSKYAARQKELWKQQREERAASKSNLAKVPDWVDTHLPDEPPIKTTMGGFSAFDASDYAVKSGTGADARWLTVSPLRAVMREQQGLAEHIVTERTRQGVLYGAGLGMEAPVLARIMGLDVDQLQDLYSAELATAPHLMMSDIQTNLYNIARDPRHPQSVRAGQYLLARLGNKLYREEQKQSTALAVRPDTRTVDVSLLDDDQRGALKDILMAAMRLAQPAEPSYGRAVEAEYAEVDETEGAELL